MKFRITYNLRQILRERPFLGNDLRQIGELWTHLSASGSKRKRQNVFRNFQGLTSNRTPKHWKQCSTFSSTMRFPQRKNWDQREGRSKLP